MHVALVTEEAGVRPALCTFSQRRQRAILFNIHGSQNCTANSLVRYSPQRSFIHYICICSASQRWRPRQVLIKKLIFNEQETSTKVINAKSLQLVFQPSRPNVWSLSEPTVIC